MTNADSAIQTSHHENPSPVDLELNRAAKLASVEIVVGSIGHGFKIPFTGFFLSLNQLYFLANALNKDKLPRRSTLEISGITAALKSLSVSGQKVGPMFSIFVQGLLFYIGTVVAGAGLAGQIIGGFLLSLWSFAQTLLGSILIFGLNYLKMLEYFTDKLLSDNLWIRSYALFFILLLIAGKIILALGLVLLSYFKKDELQFINTSALEKIKSSHQVSTKDTSRKLSPWLAALKDLTKPFFLLNFIFVTAFLFLNKTDSDYILFYLCRSLAFAYILFFLLRYPPVHRMIKSALTKNPKGQRFYEKASRVYEKIMN